MNKQQIINKYTNANEINENDFAEILGKFGLISNNPENNAQILCHGAGERGIKNLESIINKEGVAIVRDFEDSNNYVSSGVLSTNVIANNRSNEVDVYDTMKYKYHPDSKGEFYTLVTAFPLEIGDLILGRIIKHSNGVACILDDLGIKNIPKEFILGVVKTDVNGKMTFKINNHFFAINEKNYQNAIDSINKIYASSNYENQDNYFRRLSNRKKNDERRRQMGLQVSDVTIAYQEYALNKYNEKQKTEEEGLGL